MRLGIDLDGVVADFTNGWMRLYNAEFGTELTPDLVETWSGALELTHFTSKRDFWDWAHRDRAVSLFRGLDTYPEAVSTLRRLSGEHQIVIITAKPGWAVHDTYAWIAEHRLPTREVHIIAQKWIVSCDVYLDDSPQQLRDLSHSRPEAVVCRFVRPWNRPLDRVVDVAGWAEFAELVRELSHRSV
jgi:5'(3')-deoxyribonucleotidase